MTVRELILAISQTVSDQQLDLPVMVGDCCPRHLDSVEVQGDVLILGGAG